jgi:organic hydroperoxide reductase OsmC/OhrA
VSPGRTSAASEAELEALHHRSHDECYIANSIRAEVSVEAPAFSFA